MKGAITKSILSNSKITFSDKVKDRSHDPYFVKKVEASKKTLRRVGFPDELLKLQAERLKK
ncbi:hypothetical protein FBD94_13350 [Pedobacter hiemivivus]|jgi:hypothetical protein|uniref:Uncharacterized protein n=1 Tax=Pedobacter hiemivivus TaxID=2530454 RepID=A0A4U1GAK6_9SPHI|nr:hypothetical protein [Pedobacter hiemivivus]TKC59909.1 hypothetical protein FBD94_13350 [Pedobacter hiemivivus]